MYINFKFLLSSIQNVPSAAKYPLPQNVADYGKRISCVI